MRRPKKLSLREQAAYLRYWWKSFETKVRNGTLTSTGELRPNQLCRTYLIEVQMNGKERPSVRVLQPALVPRVNGELIPHMYSQERLCLFLPNTGEWTSEMPIATSIIPWASVWLYFYEVWLATGEWLGGGVEPEQVDQLVKGAKENE